MLFSSTVFLTLFLPLVLLLYFGLPKVLRNSVLLLASLFFYAWGEAFLVVIMLASIAANFGFGLWVERARERGGAKLAVAAAVVFDLGLLFVFKYANWIWGLVSDDPLAAVFGPTLVRLGLLPELPPDDWSIRLPIGISFFTFQAMSYVIDVYRRDGPVQRNPIHFGVYIALFPQLIAGPIVRYRDVALQIVDRVVTLDGFAWGVRRFLIGLGKKVLVANVVAQVADGIFGTQAAPGVPAHELTVGVAWLGLLCYTIQIYFDFSGYSDMAIGLGRMFGFRFLENFDHPYVARSITEFWRRWHISLSSWYRDYLYIPLGGNRHGPGRTYFNLVLVFFLCGLWHGASASFVVWGLYHGAFLVIERLGLARVLGRAHPALRHLYLLLVVMVGWVFFRADDFTYASAYAATLFGAGAEASGVWAVGHFWSPLLAIGLACGVIGSTPWQPRLAAWRARTSSAGLALAYEASALVCLLSILVLSALELAAGSYNPFIYFRF
ncbi:MAG: MBOAT family protein [bacterium]|nr:MBOAT family protein [bacterium]